MTRYRATEFRRSPLRLPGAALAWLWLAGRRFMARLCQFIFMRAVRADEKRIVVFRLGSIGDHLAAVPVLDAIRARHPRAEITLVTNAGPLPPWPVQVGVTINVRTYTDVAQLRGVLAELKPSAVYYLAPHPLTLRRALRDCLFFALCGIWRGRGFTPVDATGWTARALRPWHLAPPQHNRLADACGLALAQRVMPAVNTTGTIALVPAGKYPVQHWPSGSFRQLAAQLRASGAALMWLGGPEDAARAVECGALPEDENLVGKLDIKACAEVMARCKAVVCNDTGLAHLAASIGVPLVVVTSSRNAAGAWTPAGEPSRVRILRSDVACESCQLQECASLICLRLIEPQQVMLALAQMGAITAPGASPQS